MNLLNNAGGGGSSSIEQLARFDDEVIAFNPAFIWYDGPRNDITRLSTAISAGQFDSTYSLKNIISRVKQMYAKANAIGAVFCCGSVTPVASGHTAYSVLNSGREWQFNAWARRYALQHRNFIYVPQAEAIIDTSSPGGAPKANYLNPSDFVHWTPMSARAIGQAFATAVSDRLPPISMPAGCYCDDHTLNRQTLTSIVITDGVALATKTGGHGLVTGESGVLYGATPAAINGWHEITVLSTDTFSFPTTATGVVGGSLFWSTTDAIGNNPTMVAGAGGTVTAPATGAVPAGYTGAKSGPGSAVAYSVIPHATAGFATQAVATFSADGENLNLRTGELKNRCPMGEKVYMEALISLSGMSGVRSIGFSLQALIDGTTYVSETLNTTLLGSANFDQSDITEHLIRTPEFTIPAGTTFTSLQGVFQITAGGAGGVTATIANWQPRRVNPDY
jgi:hypothetical protein